MHLKPIVPFFVWLGYLPLLAIVPLWTSLAGSAVSPSPARAEGYSSHAAYLAMALWSLVAVVLGWLASSGPRAKLLAEVRDQDAPPAKWPLWVIPLIVLALYFPLILARSGPFSEDGVFLTALQRMQFGDRPYQNFEFLYGPLMIYLPYYWTRVFGHSQVSIYSYIAIIEAAFFFVVYWLLRKVIPSRRRVWIAFAVLAALTFNILIGPNQNGFRKLLPAIVLVMAAWGPESILRAIACGALMGAQLAYSHDYGIAGVCGTAAIYVLASLNSRGTRALFAGIVFYASTAAAWFALAYATLGATFHAYIRETLELMRLFSSNVAAFRFVWTANSLALFGLLAIACVGTGVALCTARSGALQKGDLLLCGATLFALVALKSGLNRCDLWHFQPAFLPLVLAAFIAWPSRWVDGHQLRWSVPQVLAIIAAATSLVALAPTARWVAGGWVNGARALLSGAPNVIIESRSPSIISEQGPARREPTLIAIAAYLARKPYAPVYYYGNACGLGPFAGVPKRDPINDDYLFSENKGLIARDWLVRNQRALVVIFRDVYDRLSGTAPPLQGTIESWQPSRAKQVIAWLSSPHFRAAPIDDAQKEQRFAHTVGAYVKTSYEVDRDFGPLLTLRPVRRF